MNSFLSVAVVGLHLSGQPLNHQLISLNSSFIRSCKTAACYALYLVEDEKGRKPALVKLPHNQVGNQFELEIWDIPMKNVGQFLSAIPSPLGLGTLFLDDGSCVHGFICEPRVIAESRNISSFSGWKTFLASEML